MFESQFNNDAEDRKATMLQQAREGGKAVAEGSVVMNSAAFQAFLISCGGGGSDIWIQSRLAGILAAKQSDQMMLVSYSADVVTVDLSYSVDEAERRVTLRCELRTRERIGAEMSALVGCGVALLALANSLRAIDRDMAIEGLRIVRE
jgi:cyclic pyranopterin phosphate synthase